MFQHFADVIQSWGADVRQDIYALSFLIDAFDDDPRESQVHLGYNTITQWHSQITRASSSDEAKWNFAFWLQNVEAIVPDIGAPEGPPLPNTPERQLRDDWLQALGLYFGHEDEPEEDAAFVAVLDRWVQVTGAFVVLCVRVARRLHDAGVIEGVFGRPVPIIVRELEGYPTTVANQAQAANPPDVAVEFENWALGRRNRSQHSTALPEP